MPEIVADETPLEQNDRIVNYCDGCSTAYMLPRTLVKLMSEVEDKRIRCDICGNHFQALNSRRASELPGLGQGFKLGEHVYRARADVSVGTGDQVGDVVEQYR